MKKTLSIHFGRQLFIIEEDAYSQLQQYLNRLELSLSGNEGASEIIEDIEMRFAELLLSYLGSTRKVVNSEDVERGIASLGEPEVIVDEEATSAPHEHRNYDKTEQTKRFFRDPEEGILGGVCSGISAYFNIDPLLVRIIFVCLIFFVGMAIPLYLLLWILMPVAVTPSDRLRMKGKSVNIDSLKEEFERAAERLKHDAKSAKDRFRSGNDPYVNRAKSILQSLIRIAGVIVIALTFLWMLFYTCFIFGWVEFIPSTGDSEYLSFTELLRIAIPDPNTNFFVWTSILTLGISTIVMAYLLGFRMLTGKRMKWLKVAFLVTSLVFFTGILTGVIGGIQSGRDFAVYTELDVQQLAVTSDTLHVEEYTHFSNDNRVVSTGGADFIHLKNGIVSCNGISLNYRQSKDSSFHIYQRVSAHAVDRTKAIKRCENIRNYCLLKGNVLTLDPMFSFPAKDGFRDQSVLIIVEIPQGKHLLVKGEEKTLAEPVEYDYLRVNDGYEDWD